MESRIPLPTDNIYKFYALFGLLLFIFSTGASIYNVRSANEVVFQTIVENQSLSQITNPTPAEVTRKAVLQKRYEIALADRKFFDAALGVLVGFALLLMVYGFCKWHIEVQPIQDEMAKLQLKKLRHEVSQLNQPDAPSAEPPQEDQPEAED